jgi:hypothetical protein
MQPKVQNKMQILSSAINNVLQKKKARNRLKHKIFQG